MTSEFPGASESKDPLTFVKVGKGIFPRMEARTHGFRQNCTTFINEKSSQTVMLLNYA